MNNWIKKINSLSANCLPFVFIIDFDMQNPIILTRQDFINNTEILFDINGMTNFENNISTTILPPLKTKIELSKFPISFKDYSTAFEIVQQHLRAGDTYLVNLTFPTEIKINLSLEEIFFRSSAKYKLYFKDKFVVFSPETFIKIRNSKIFTFPMKGTINAAIENAEQIILADQRDS